MMNRRLRLKRARTNTTHAWLGRAARHILGLMVICVITSVADAAEKRPRVLTSFLPIYCWTVHVAGDFADVENLLSAKAEPHEYAFAPGDARRLAQADLILVNGLSMEGWLPKFLRSTPAARERVVTVTGGLKGELSRAVTTMAMTMTTRRTTNRPMPIHTPGSTRNWRRTA
jgi:ABC-type Zn2+ transport system substrate-binding protein/surface adhesin